MITDGAKPIRDYYEVNCAPFLLSFFDNLGDNYTVVAWAKRLPAGRLRPGHPLRPVPNQLDSFTSGLQPDGRTPPLRE